MREIPLTEAELVAESTLLLTEMLSGLVHDLADVSQKDLKYSRTDYVSTGPRFDRIEKELDRREKEKRYGPKGGPP